ncbi:putative zinc fyve domain-containing protein [Rosellinia necatrix]|uniref:Putative zinc fyve domain-containing protein n=1 Tax=Rosellinia necatrix TaxID=77044 RepID=A0A1W2TBI7_ROSNE|nr:putative zinc fyve domain-containing protein [Rosellinia necatrix]
MNSNGPASDRTLLERLNALKPSSVSLSPPSSNIVDPASTIERVRSPSRADTLATRLKSLRNQVSESTDTTATREDHGIGVFVQPHPTGEPGASKGNNKLGRQQTTASFQVTDDVGPLLHADDQTLDELLEDLRSDESWLDEVAAQEEEHQRVTALLTELGRSGGANGKHDEENTNRSLTPEGDEHSSDDNSDIMEIDTDSVLAKTMDEIAWEKANQPPSPQQPVSTLPGNARGSSQSGTAQTPNDSPFRLPTVPSDFQDQQDAPTPSAQAQSDIDFAASIASRMAALKLSGSRALPSAPTVDVDSLDLPQAPTFVPADRPVPGLTKRTGLTDEDQKTWCVVCLADGTVHCIGCEPGDDIYCARCWKEMHVGPRAGYDERGHSWETFASRPR